MASRLKMVSVGKIGYKLGRVWRNYRRVGCVFPGVVENVWVVERRHTGYRQDINKQPPRERWFMHQALRVG